MPVIFLPVWLGVAVLLGWLGWKTQAEAWFVVAFAWLVVVGPALLADAGFRTVMSMKQPAGGSSLQRAAPSRALPSPPTGQGAPSRELRGTRVQGARLRGKVRP